MEHETIDFDINNYTLKDLEYFFKLEAIENYTFMHIESQANIIQNQILNHHTFNADEKTGFIHFIQQGKQRLMSGKPLTRKKYIVNIDSRFRPSEQEEADHLTIDLNKDPKSYTNIRSMKISAIHLPPNLLESHDYILFAWMISKRTQQASLYLLFMKLNCTKTYWRVWDRRMIMFLVNRVYMPNP